MSHRLHGHHARRSSPLYTSARYVLTSFFFSLFAASWLALQFNPIPPKSSISDALASRTPQVSDTTTTSSLVPALRRPTSLSPPSSPTLPQLTPPPSAPVSRPAPLPDSSAEKKRLPSPVRPWQGRWFAFSQQTSAKALRAC